MSHLQAYLDLLSLKFTFQFRAESDDSPDYLCR